MLKPNSNRAGTAYYEFYFTTLIHPRRVCVGVPVSVHLVFILSLLSQLIVSYFIFLESGHFALVFVEKFDGICDKVTFSTIIAHCRVHIELVAIATQEDME